MPRPRSKSELLTTAQEKFDILWEVISNLTTEEFETEFMFSRDLCKKADHWKRDKNIRDILVHLYEWHQLAIQWIYKNQRGEKAPFLPEPYTFKNYGKMNRAVWKKHQDTSYEKSVQMLKNSHRDLLKLIDTFTNEELFTKKYFDWTGTTSVGSYCISSTSSHYDWAIKKIKKHKKHF